MEWNDKLKMVKLLNNGKYKEATDYYLGHEVWSSWNDIQALSMYANGIDLTKSSDCMLFEDKLKDLQINHKEQYGNLGFRESLRLAMLQDEFEKLHKGMSNFKKQ
jgi:hypothetical protein